MRELQKSKLGDKCRELGAQILWCDKVDELEPCMFEFSEMW
jgi:hypothetical protein